MANRLAHSSSPYLLQHADNPVDWYEWGNEAFTAAREGGRPVILSVGYSSCHWCHVMAHESFEDNTTAEFMNDNFINIKVDREERPDVDRIYMDAVQAMTGHGGWPMTVFLTPDGRPFYAGTYYPKEDRPGLPSFMKVMTAVIAAWSDRQDEIKEQAARMTDLLRREIEPASDLPGIPVLEAAYRSLQASFDHRNGGFGGAPKFPQAPTLEFLLRVAGADWATEASPMLHQTLEAMARGGIYDHLGGGFARYSVDERWLIPHFEKMLYDNALLARTYLRGWQITGDDRFRTVAVETLDYLLRDLRLPGGGFASAEDADSEGEEGKFYVWDHPEFQDVVGDDSAVAADFFGVTPGGNFEGRTILSEAAGPDEVAKRRGVGMKEAVASVTRAKEKLRERRETRVRPGLDDKVVAAWNGLALRALAEAGAVLGDKRYLAAARANARFVLGEVRRDDGRLLRSWREGTGSVPAFCDDYAAYALGLFALYQATGEPEWYRSAAELTADMIDLFADPEGPGFFTTGRDAEALIARPKELMDNPVPAANSLAAEALLHLAQYTGDVKARDDAFGVFRLAGPLLETYPQAVGHLLATLYTAITEPKEVAIVGREGAARDQLLAVVYETFRPDSFVAIHSGDGEAGDEFPLFAGRVPHDGPPLAYVCRNFACEAPTGDPEQLRQQLDG